MSQLQNSDWAVWWCYLWMGRTLSTLPQVLPGPSSAACPVPLSPVRTSSTFRSLSSDCGW